ncbi:MFS transporter [Deinococcus roseus]|uniref:MFS transporter n=1 Tax=Deinococcus roseus TaxID=392414 RepID=A0ABQ2D8Q4_9DEIO|nr:MFS transporter [Deinococcus roseus]GGJ49677.1 MFS transporter [Deinococcus roseus]
MSPALLSSRLAISVFFAVTGIAFANWVVRIPDVKAALHLSPGVLGLALLGGAIGSLCSMVFGGYLMARFGSKWVSTTSALLTCLSVILPGYAVDAWTLFGALFVYGAFNGLMDVSMNDQAALNEKQLGKSIMSSFHGVFSLGGVIGSVMGGWLSSQHIPVGLHLTYVGLFLAVVVLLGSRFLIPTPPHPEDAHSEPVFIRPAPSLWIIGIMAFCVMLGEGGMADWSSVYLRENLKASADQSATGYAAFSGLMMLGRFVGDSLINRFGSARVVGWGGGIMAAGLILGLLVNTLPAVVVGFACVGLGCSALFPCFLSTASRNPDMRPASAITAVSTMAYFGFLAGPPVLGLLAGQLGLKTALLLIAAAGLFVLFNHRKVQA